MTLDDTTSKIRGDGSDDIHDEKSPIDVTEKASHTTHSSVENLYQDGLLEPVYYAKTLVLNRAIEEIGMGKYQVRSGSKSNASWPEVNGKLTFNVISPSTCSSSCQASDGSRKCPLRIFFQNSFNSPGMLHGTAIAYGRYV